MVFEPPGVNSLDQMGSSSLDGLRLCALAAIGLVGLVNVAMAKSTVLHCRGYQISDHHQLTDQLIVLDLEKKIVISIQLLGTSPKDVINAPIEIRCLVPAFDGLDRG
jgi:hypothetical protein